MKNINWIKKILLLSIFGLNSYASIQTIEGLFRNGNNADVSGDLVVLTFQVREKINREFLNKKIVEMKGLEITIQKLIKTHDQQEEAKMQSLVKIYEAMKPKDAARIFEELDINTLLMVAERMKERKLAPVMARMNSEKAMEMTVELTKIRNLPDPGT